MKLAVILPGDFGREICAQRKEYIAQFTSIGTEIKVFTTGGAKAITSGIDFALISPGTVKQVIEAENTGFDGIVLHGMCDFSIEAARVAVNIPVVGAGSATYHVAYQLADRFGVISSNEKTVPELKRRIILMDCYNRMTSIKPLNIPVLQMVARKDELEDKFVKIAKYQIEVEGAQLIVAGTDAIFPAMGHASKERIEQKLSVPVLEGSSIAIKTLEMLVNLKLTHSKKTYPSPT